MNTNFFILASIFLVCLVIRTVYERLEDTRRINADSKTIIVIVIAAMCGLWISWFALCPIDPFRLNLSPAERSLGFVLFLLGTLLVVGALVQLRGVENIDHLVTTGLFTRFRHPMYTGFILWIIGWSVYHDAAASLAIGCAGIANILYWRRLEDVRLEASYGDLYRKHRSQTWF